MLSYIKGSVISCTPTNLVVETTSGFGLEVLITLGTYESLKDKKTCQLYTHLHVKKEGQMFSGYELYGFEEVEDKAIFELVITVSGIGASIARLMLNSMSHKEIKRAILSDDERSISAIKGIGPKTAKRLILELKDKIAKVETVDSLIDIKQNNSKEEALLALISLGFQRNTIIKVLNTIDKSEENLTVETYIKLALKAL